MTPLGSANSLLLAAICLSFAGCTDEGEPGTGGAAPSWVEVDQAPSEHPTTPAAEMTLRGDRTESLTALVTGERLHVTAQWPADGRQIDDQWRVATVDEPVNVP